MAWFFKNKIKGHKEELPTTLFQVLIWVVVNKVMEDFNLTANLVITLHLIFFFFWIEEKIHSFQPFSDDNQNFNISGLFLNMREQADRFILVLFSGSRFNKVTCDLYNHRSTSEKGIS